jgi:hypothetical protein
MNIVNKAAVSVSEMARMLGMSRARFYQLLNDGVFPSPRYEVSTKRPFFDEEAQNCCLEVRRRNYGMNGKPVLFYPPRSAPPQPQPKKAKPKVTAELVELIDSLSSLGLMATAEQVEAALKECYPKGVADTDKGEVIRTLFLFLKRQESCR